MICADNPNNFSKREQERAKQTYRSGSDIKRVLFLEMTDCDFEK